MKVYTRKQNSIIY